MRALSFIAVALVASALSEDVTVDTLYGPVVGEKDPESNTVSFLGVPYAEPPVGDRRWRNPIPPTPWTQPRPAKEHAHDCPQFLNSFTQKVSEDCLYLQVWTPSVTPSTPLPVQVWFYGGAFVNGSSSFFMYHGGLVSSYENIVIVTINYRLGIFGFLASETMRDRSPDGAVGNYALQDQQESLRWVQGNIARFGGDPNRVTIFGESAGGASVALHMLMPQSVGLFSRAVMESGTPTFWARRKLSTADLDFSLVSMNVGCLKLTKQASFECLMTKNTTELLHAGKSSLWSPAIDGVLIPEDPIVMARNGNFSNRVPTITGSNKNEGTMFALSIGQNIEDWLYQAMIGILFGLDGLVKINMLYPSFKYESAWWALSDVIGDWAFVCPSRRMARDLRAANIPTWQYFFTRNNTKSPKELQALYGGAPCIRTCHGMEVPYVFRYIPQFNDEQDIALSSAMTHAWSTLGHSGTLQAPPFDSLFEWPPYETDTDETMVFDIQLSTVKNLRKAKCDFFDEKDAVFSHPRLAAEDRLGRLLEAYHLAKLKQN